MTRTGFPTNALAARIAGGESRLRRQLVAAELQYGRQLDQFGLVLVGVMLAEKKLGTGRQLGADPCSRAAPIAPVSPG
jgi:hypothetical protein